MQRIDSNPQCSQPRHTDLYAFRARPEYPGASLDGERRLGARLQRDALLKLPLRDHRAVLLHRDAGPLVDLKVEPRVGGAPGEVARDLTRQGHPPDAAQRSSFVEVWNQSKEGWVLQLPVVLLLGAEGDERLCIQQLRTTFLELRQPPQE